MADPIPTEVFLQGLAETEDPDPSHPVTTAGLLDGLLALQAAFARFNRAAVDPELGDAERAAFAALSTQMFAIVRTMVGPSLCLFLKILHRPETAEATRAETRAYLAGFLTDAELDGLSEDELCALLLERLRARGFPVPDGG